MPTIDPRDRLFPNTKGSEEENQFLFFKEQVGISIAQEMLLKGMSLLDNLTEDTTHKIDILLTAVTIAKAAAIQLATEDDLKRLDIYSALIDAEKSLVLRRNLIKDDPIETLKRVFGYKP